MLLEFGLQLETISEVLQQENHKLTQSLENKEKKALLGKAGAQCAALSCVGGIKPQSRGFFGEFPPLS